MKTEYGRCEGCLNQIGSRKVRRRFVNMVCACGHKTPPAESRKLQEIVLALGIQEMDKLVKSDIELALFAKRKQYGGRDSATYAVNLSDMLAAITIDIEKIIPKPEIETAGIAATRKLILKTQDWFEQTRAFVPTFEQAAAVVASIYNPETKSLGTVTVQNGADSFYLGCDIDNTDALLAACHQTPELVYFRNKLADVRIIAGQAEIKYLTISEGVEIAQIANPEFPLVIAYQTQSIKDNQLFVFRKSDGSK
jgi:hypothetical protein